MGKSNKSGRKSTIPIDRNGPPAKGPSKGNTQVKRLPRHQGR